MFSKWIARYKLLKELLSKSDSYTIMLVPDDGKEIHRGRIESNTMSEYGRKLTIFTAVACVTTALVYAASIKTQSERLELAEYKENKVKQEEQLKELKGFTEKIQHQLTEFSRLEDDIRKQMQEAGMKVPDNKVSDLEAAALGGKGGGSEHNVTELQLLLAKNKYLYANLEAKNKHFSSLIEELKENNYRREMTPDFWPTEGGYISSYFGGRDNPFDGTPGDDHPGIDIAVYYGVPIYAGASGVVERAGWYGGYGIYARIRHDFGYKTAYGHMNDVVVSAGEYVKKGQLIGYAGSTGYSTGPHLHYEVLLYGEQVDPMKLMRK